MRCFLSLLVAFHVEGICAIGGWWRMPFRNHVKIGTSKHKFEGIQSFCQLFLFICICVYIYIIISHTDIKEGLQSPASKCFFPFHHFFYNRTMHFWGSRHWLIELTLASFVVDNMFSFPRNASLVPKSCWKSCWGLGPYGWTVTSGSSQHPHGVSFPELQMCQGTRGLSECQVHNPYTWWRKNCTARQCSKHPIADALWHHEELCRISKSKD